MRDRSFLITLLTVTIVLLVSSVITYYLYIPAWRVFLEFEGFWLPLLALTVGFGLLSLINLPLPLWRRDIHFHVNVMGCLTPPALAYWVAQSMSLDGHPAMLIPWFVIVGLYLVLSDTRPTAVVIPTLAVNAVTLALVPYFHYVYNLPLRAVMWWTYVMQYTSLLVMDLYRAFADTDTFHPDVERLSFGGAGSQDALATGPFSGITISYIFHLLFWS